MKQCPAIGQPPLKCAFVKFVCDRSRPMPRLSAPFLNWPQQQLAKATSIGVVTLRLFERGERQPRSGTFKAIVIALEAVGVLSLRRMGKDPE